MHYFFSQHLFPKLSGPFALKTVSTNTRVKIAHPRDHSFLLGGGDGGHPFCSKFRKEFLLIKICLVVDTCSQSSSTNFKIDSIYRAGKSPSPFHFWPSVTTLHRENSRLVGFMRARLVLCYVYYNRLSESRIERVCKKWTHPLKNAVLFGWAWDQDIGDCSPPS